MQSINFQNRNIFASRKKHRGLWNNAVKTGTAPVTVERLVTLHILKSLPQCCLHNIQIFAMILLAQSPNLWHDVGCTIPKSLARCCLHNPQVFGTMLLAQSRASFHFDYCDLWSPTIKNKVFECNFLSRLNQIFSARYFHSPQ